MDADRSDYLLRDSYHCGVEYGKFDLRRMVQCLDLHEAEGAMDMKHSARLLEKLREKFSKIDFVFDAAAAWIHKLLLPEDPEATGLVALPVIEPSGDSYYLGARSHILRRMPKRFQVARIFADVDRSNEDLLRTIRLFAHDEYRKSGGLA